MVGRLLSVTGTALLIAVGLVTPVLATATATPASAQTVINGCTIVSNPTPTNFTNCPGADLAGADLAGIDFNFANLPGADLAGASFVSSFFNPDGIPSTSFDPAMFSTANLSQANLSESVFVLCAPEEPPEPPVGCGSVGFPDANLTNANLSNDLLAIDVVGEGTASTDFTGATLTGANMTGTALVPSNQSVTATSQAGAVATWPTPSAIPGATPGNCTPPSGATFPLFSSTVTCQVLDANNDVATGTFQVNVQPTTRYFTQVLVPSEGAVLAGAPYLDAAAGDGPGVTKVVFEVSGGELSNHVIATATPTLFGWLAKWNTTTVPNGIYSLVSVATDADNNTDTSTPISVTVDNPAPATTVVLPANNATISGTPYLDATASSGVTKVRYDVSGGPSDLSDVQVATGTGTLIGWLAAWNTTTVPNGTYTLQSVASYAGGVSGTSAGISVTVDNPAPATAVVLPANNATISGTPYLDATASSGVTHVTYEVSGGPSDLSDVQVATASLTYYGWLAQWNTTTVPNGTYTLQSVAAYSGGVTGTSPGVTVTVANPGLADLANSSFTSTVSGVRNSCGIVYLTFDAVYPGSAAVGNVTLHIAGCVTDPYTYAGSFTITTGVGTLSGGAMGSITYIGDTLEMNYGISLSVTTATGSFTGATGTLGFSAPYEAPDSLNVA
jgi:uncharacterized protein YjbI with pentapeptide repeats